MAFTYSGAYNAERGVCFTFPPDVYVFRTTAECRIGIDGHPLIYVGSGEEFVVKSGARYVVDRDVQLQYGYEPEQPVLKAELSSLTTIEASDQYNVSVPVNQTADLLSIQTPAAMTDAIVMATVTLVGVGGNGNVLIRLMSDPAGTLISEYATQNARSIVTLSQQVSPYAGTEYKLQLVTSNMDGGVEVPSIWSAKLQLTGRTQ